jgi:hypothetical protein
MEARNILERLRNAQAGKAIQPFTREEHRFLKDKAALEILKDRAIVLLAEEGEPEPNDSQIKGIVGILLGPCPGPDGQFGNVNRALFNEANREKQARELIKTWILSYPKED